MVVAAAAVVLTLAAFAALAAFEALRPVPLSRSRPGGAQCWSCWFNWNRVFLYSAVMLQCAQAKVFNGRNSAQPRGFEV